MATVSTTNQFRTWGAEVPSVTAPRPVAVRSDVASPAKPWWEGVDHSQFTTSFDAAQRRRLIEDDLFAGTSVAIVLTTVVGMGLLAMAATVLFTLSWGKSMAHPRAVGIDFSRWSTSSWIATGNAYAMLTMTIIALTAIAIVYRRELGRKAWLAIAVAGAAAAAAAAAAAVAIAMVNLWSP
jgi:hypothetical protein